VKKELALALIAAASALAHASAQQNQADCGCEAKQKPEIAAIVNGVKIALKEIEEPLKDKIESLRLQVIQARKRELDLQINSKLLAAEAKRRNMTAARLLEQEVLSKVKDPTEAEARSFYEQNKDKIREPFEKAKDDIISYLRFERENQRARELAEELRATAKIEVLSREVAPPENEAARGRILALVDGEKITLGDVEDSLRPLIYSVQEQIFALEQRQLNLKINDLLLEQEAQRRGIAPRALLETEVWSKVKKPDEAAIRSFYDLNKNRIQGNFEEIKEQIALYLQQQEQYKLEAEFADKLRKSASIQILLSPPEPPLYDIAADDQPTRGNPNAPVTIVEFTDYQCPSCARMQPIIEKLLEEYSGKVKLVVRDFPLSQHREAFKAAEAAEAARQQGKYWEYVALLYKNQNDLSPDSLKRYASQIGLDRSRFDQALDGGGLADQVLRDLQEGTKIGVSSTPTIFINGRQLRELSYESLKAAIEAALAQKPR
jgi:protein-disulfide isomerase